MRFAKKMRRRLGAFDGALLGSDALPPTPDPSSEFGLRIERSAGGVLSLGFGWSYEGETPPVAPLQLEVYLFEEQTQTWFLLDTVAVPLGRIGVLAVPMAAGRGGHVAADIAVLALDSGDLPAGGYNIAYGPIAYAAPVGASDEGGVGATGPAGPTGPAGTFTPGADVTAGAVTADRLLLGLAPSTYGQVALVSGALPFGHNYEDLVTESASIVPQRVISGGAFASGAQVRVQSASWREYVFRGETPGVAATESAWMGMGPNGTDLFLLPALGPTRVLVVADIFLFDTKAQAQCKAFSLRHPFTFSDGTITNAAPTSSPAATNVGTTTAWNVVTDWRVLGIDDTSVNRYAFTFRIDVTGVGVGHPVRGVALVKMFIDD